MTINQWLIDSWWFIVRCVHVHVLLQPLQVRWRESNSIKSISPWCTIWFWMLCIILISSFAKVNSNGLCYSCSYDAWRVICTQFPLIHTHNQRLNVVVLNRVDESVSIEDVKEVFQAFAGMMDDIQEQIQKRWQARSISTLIESLCAWYLPLDIDIDLHISQVLILINCMFGVCFIFQCYTTKILLCRDHFNSIFLRHAWSTR